MKQSYFYLLQVYKITQRDFKTSLEENNKPKLIR